MTNYNLIYLLLAGNILNATKTCVNTLQGNDMLQYIYLVLNHSNF